MKFDRHSKILQLIEEKDILTQEELADELRKSGCIVTQATVSRDIKDLRLVKVLSVGGVYKYASMDRADATLTDRLIRVFTDSVVSMEHANNLIVIKTITASAQAAASTIDALNWKEIIGCIAGDDTILVVVRDNEQVGEVLKRFRKLLR